MPNWEKVVASMRQDGNAPVIADAEDNDSDDDIPELVENFDEASEK